MQLNKRLHRPGQKHRTVIHHLVMQGTEDMNVIESLEKKQSKQDGLMQAIKAKIKKYIKNRRN